MKSEKALQLKRNKRC